MSRHGQADNRCHYDVFAINAVNVPTLMTITRAEVYLKYIRTFCVNVIRISILMTVVVKNTWLQNTVLGTRRIIHSAGDLYRTFSNNFSRYKTTLPTYDARAMPATQDSLTRNLNGVMPVLYHSSINFNTSDKMSLTLIEYVYMQYTHVHFNSNIINEILMISLNITH